MNRQRLKFRQIAASPETIVILSAIRFYLRRMFRKDWIPEWDKQEPVIEESNQLGDLATAFFLHSITSGGYKEVVEIGSYSGKRILELKKLLPHCTFHGLDVVKSYKEPFTRLGVDFHPYTLSFFDREFSHPLVICNGVLHYMSAIELAEFISVLAKKNIPIAFFEPTLPVSFGSRSISRRKGKHGYYHPYDQLFLQHGFSLEVKSHGLRSGHTSSQKTLECYTYDLAVPVVPQGHVFPASLVPAVAT